MKMIQLFMEHIDDELQDAHDYATLALENKDTEPEAADLFARLSEEEMQHAKLLHEMVATYIERLRRNGGVVPESMAAVYEYLHKKQIKRAKAIRECQSMYRGG